MPIENLIFIYTIVKQMFTIRSDLLLSTLCAIPTVIFFYAFFVKYYYNFYLNALIAFNFTVGFKFTLKFKK